MKTQAGGSTNLFIIPLGTKRKARVGNQIPFHTQTINWQAPPIALPLAGMHATIKWMTNGSPSCLNSCCKADIPTYSIYCADGTTPEHHVYYVCCRHIGRRSMWGSRVDTHTSRNPLFSCRTVSGIFTLPLGTFKNTASQT